MVLNQLSAWVSTSADQSANGWPGKATWVWSWTLRRRDWVMQIDIGTSAAAGRCAERSFIAAIPVPLLASCPCLCAFSACLLACLLVCLLVCLLADHYFGSWCPNRKCLFRSTRLLLWCLLKNTVSVAKRQNAMTLPWLSRGAVSHGEVLRRTLLLWFSFPAVLVTLG